MRQHSGWPRLRDDLRLREASPNPDGSPAWMLHDPVRNRFFRIGWLEYEFLGRWHTGDPRRIVARIREETPLQPSDEQLDTFVRWLTQNQLLEVHAREQMDYLHRLQGASAFSFFSWLLHHYLYFRMPLVHPQDWLDRTLPRIRFVFSRAWWLAVLFVGLAGLVMAGRQWDSFEQTFLYFFNWQGMACYALALIAAKTLHELGHAYTARRYGIRVPVMGVAFIVMWPVLYTDTDETWKLLDRRQRLAIASAGILAEACLAALCTFLWCVTPDGALRSVFFFLGTTSVVTTLAVNLNPLMRFDGYYLAADWLDMPNLLERSFALTNWTLRKALLNFRDPVPEAMPSSRHALLCLYGFAIWIYRFFLFLGIAWLVYHKFFKVLGIFLMLVEIEWYLFRPVRREIRVWLARREEIDRGRLAAVAGGLLCAALLLPWSHRATLPALAHERDQQFLYAGMPARLASNRVPQGGAVRKGQVLFELDSPDLDYQLQAARVRVAEATIKLNRAPLEEETQEQSQVVRKQLAEALADARGVEAQMARLRVTAPFDGVLRDVPDYLAPGTWLGTDNLLGIVVKPDHPVVDAWLREGDLRAVRIGEPAVFYPSREDGEPFPLKVVAIDPTSTANLPDPLLASTHGGDIAVRQGPKGELVTHEALYRIVLEPAGAVDWPSQVMRGHVELDVGAATNLLSGITRSFSALIRESGF